MYFFKLESFLIKKCLPKKMLVDAPNKPNPKPAPAFQVFIIS